MPTTVSGPPLGVVCPDPASEPASDARVEIIAEPGRGERSERENAGMLERTAADAGLRTIQR